MAKFWGSGKFPYTQLNNLNLDWLIKCVQELAAQIVEAVRGDIVQNKSAEWKTRARQNIDAASAGDLASLGIEVGTLGENVADAVRGDITQNKSVEWKTRARQNIDAQSTSAIIDVEHGGTGATTVVDALNALSSTGLLYFGGVSNELVLNFSGAVRFLMIISSNANSRQGAAIVYSTSSSSTPVITPIGTLGSSITLTGGKGSLTVTMSSSSSVTSAILLCLTAASYSRITAGQANSLSMLAEEQTTSPAALAEEQTTSPAALAEEQTTSPAELSEE